MVEIAGGNNNAEQDKSKTILDEDLFDEDTESYANEESDSSKNGNKKKDSSKRKRNRNRKKKTAATTTTSNNGATAEKSESDNDKENDEDKIEIELVPEEVVLDTNFAEFTRIFDRFKFTSSQSGKSDQDEEAAKKASSALSGTGKAAELERFKARMFEDEEEEEREKKEQGETQQAKLSKKKLKQQTRLSVAALKQLVQRPDVVEMHDVTAADPKLLVYLKSIRNSVQVPRHWCAKRKYLQGKRGFEKPAFDLPDFIKRTGIQSMREAVQEKDKNKSLKQKMREKVRPKTGRVDIDYQKLHDAFFRWQTKPRMTIHGDLYYEGKELETRLKEKKPGNLTDDLRIALGMPTGPNADKVPPPWLIAMQRYGPPPSYPSLKIPGLNAPIPEGCSFGYHAGGWGKPPVDEFGRPLYGDVFGSTSSDLRKPLDEEPVDQSLWGEMEDEVYEVMPEELEEEEEEEEEEGGEAKEGEVGEEEEGEEEVSGEDAAAGLKTPGEGLMTPSGISTGLHTAGLETPDMIELRKRKHQIEADMEGGEDEDGEAPALYKVLPEKSASIGASMMGSSKVYDLSAAKKVHVSDSGFDMTLNPDELDLASDVLQSKLDAQLRQQQQQAGGRSELDLEGDETGGGPKRKKKREEEVKPAKPAVQQQQPSADKSKKYKEFKF